jgi:hypothetical protein
MIEVKKIVREASKSLVLLVHPHATVTVALHPVAEVQGPRARGPLSPGRRQLPPADARRLRGAARIGLFLRVRFLLSMLHIVGFCRCKPVTTGESLMHPTNQT